MRGVDERRSTGILQYVKSICKLVAFWSIVIRIDEVHICGDMKSLARAIFSRVAERLRIFHTLTFGTYSRDTLIPISRKKR